MHIFDGPTEFVVTQSTLTKSSNADRQCQYRSIDVRGDPSSKLENENLLSQEISKIINIWI